MSPGLLAAVTATLFSALPPPPKQVLLTGRGTFGEIHFDHEAHLARRIPCKSCHGPGPVQKPELTPGSAHETCRACHVQQNRGPTSCRDCHTNVREMGATLAPATATTTATSAHAEPSAAEGGAVSNGTATPTATATSTPTPRALREGGNDPPLLRTVHAGFAMMSGGARTGSGVAVNVTLERGPWIAGSEIDWTNGPGAQRTLALFGAGVGVPLGELVRARAVALGGIDAGTPAYVLPAVGARLGLELRHRRPGHRLLPSADASVAFIAALGSRTGVDGQPERETALVLSLLLGWALPAP
jgi:hypothetical protein